MGTKSSKPIRGTGKGTETGKVHTKKFTPKQLEARLDHAGKTGTLSLSAAKLKDVPPRVYTLTILRKLDLSHNDLTSLHIDVGSLVNLRTLHVQHNKLRELPPSLAGLSSLQELSVEGNELSVLPPLPETLRELNASSNRFSSVPESITDCRSLQVVNFSRNQLVEFPVVLASLPRLSSLDLDGNAIATLANVTSFAGVPELQVLILSNNRLSAAPGVLPRSLFVDTRLHRLHLPGNDIRKRELYDLDGFNDFLERRKTRINKGLSADVGGADHLCGL